jgi:hypothetical protein
MHKGEYSIKEYLEEPLIPDFKLLEWCTTLVDEWEIINL